MSYQAPSALDLRGKLLERLKLLRGMESNLASIRCVDYLNSDKEEDKLIAKNHLLRFDFYNEIIKVVDGMYEELEAEAHGN